jgi:hypothetical protein
MRCVLVCAEEARIDPDDYSVRAIDAPCRHRRRRVLETLPQIADDESDE